MQYDKNVHKVSLFTVCISQFLVGVAMTLLMTVLWVAATQFIKSSYTGLLSPPVSRPATELATTRN